ncbi:2Fe-2S iron-sulfur cluster-binding protein [Streptomyces sp. NPDC019990]|uniref:2Fe-2S iron-sulfur cluster-binding protein n=1 Tax=Streptomyces sp. NPDC019990 TaxID=3154693 RepID=UPI0033D27685
MTDDQHGEGTPRGGSRWDPLPRGEYDDGATAFVELPEGGVDALLAADSPLAAPGHGYVPPQIAADPSLPAGADPTATGWPVPGAPVDGTQWHDPHAAHHQGHELGVHQQPGHDTGHQSYDAPYGSGAGVGQHGGDDRFTYHPGATGHWNHEEAAASETAPGHDVTGQWSIPVAGGDLPDESGEFTTSALVEQWGGTPPPTLPGGAPAPWATQAAGQSWGEQALRETAVEEPSGPGYPPGHQQGQGHGAEQDYGSPDGHAHGHEQPGAHGYAPHQVPEQQPSAATPPQQQDPAHVGHPPLDSDPVGSEHGQPAAGHVPGESEAAEGAAEQSPPGHGAEQSGYAEHGAEPAGADDPGPRPSGFVDDAPEPSDASHQPAFAGHGPERPGVDDHAPRSSASLDDDPEQPAGNPGGHPGFAAQTSEYEHHGATASAEPYPAAPWDTEPEPHTATAPAAHTETAPAPHTADGTSRPAAGPGEHGDSAAGPGEREDAPGSAEAAGHLAEPVAPLPAAADGHAAPGPDAADGEATEGEATDGAAADSEIADGESADTPDEPAADDPAPDETPSAVPEPPGTPDGADRADGAAAQDAPPTRPQEEHPLASYVLRVNDAERPVTDAWIGESLLYVLRERLGLAGAKDGCSQGECGACNVQVDGRLVASCLVPAVTAAGSEVRTVEGLAEDGQPSDVQRALARCGAVQCGFCVPGMAMTVHDLLEGNPAPTELETRQALCGNLCRCSGYRGVVDAVQEVVAEREAHAAPADGDTDEPRIPHQAGPGAGGVNPSAFGSPPDAHSPEAHSPGPHAPDTHTPDPHDQPYGQDGGPA